jgi:hypothetical protein
VLKLVEQRIRAFPMTGAWQVGVNDDARQLIERWFARITLHRDVTEPLEREMWLVGFLAAALERVLNLLGRAAEIGRVEVAGLAEHLGVAKRRRLAGR